MEDSVGEASVPISGLKREHLRLQRQKLALEIVLKRRELSPRRTGSLLSDLTNPLALAVVGGFVTLMTGIVTQAFTAYENRRAEALKARFARESAREALQAELIKKFVEGQTDTVRENLRFLVDAGLIPTYSKQIRSYLDANPNAAPRVPASGLAGGITGVDDAVPVQSLGQGDVLAGHSRGVGRLLGPQGQVCTAFLIAPRTAVTAGHCVENPRSLSFEAGGVRAVASVTTQRFNEIGRANFAVLRLQRSVPTGALTLSSRTPRLNEPLSILLFRGTGGQLAVRARDCRVIFLHPDRQVFEHGCDTGPGASGAPILSGDGREVLGVHGGRLSGGRAWGTLASAITSALSE